MKMLPSPCGDKLFLLATSLYHNNLKLPSPYGDKLFLQAMYTAGGFGSGYRPLTGISCFPVCIFKEEKNMVLPSPCGDKLFREVG